MASDGARPGEIEGMPATDIVETLRLRGFLLTELVGSGAFGTVYKAMQATLGRPVAVKVFNGVGLRDAKNRARFEREGPLLARIDHASIPFVLTTGVVKTKASSTSDGDGTPYIVMQYVEGTPLSRMIANSKFAVPQATRIIQHVLSALECAHAADIVHRDVAPENIIVRGERVFLVDFSIGICISHGALRPTSVGEKVGRADYASPEQKCDSSSVGLGTDIYSAGVVLFEMLAGQPRLRLDHLDEDLRFFPPELRTIIKKACATDPGERYARAKLFYDALEPFTGAAPVSFGEPVMSLCPSPTCSKAIFTQRGFLKGPHAEITDLPYCAYSGARFIKTCKKCGSPLQRDLLAMFTKPKGAPPGRAHCAYCGEAIFITPSCKTCGSLMTAPAIESGDECSRCRMKPPGIQTQIINDSDIPF